ncbi:MAG: ribbon-helix-helix protein, CopG family [Gemmatimonadales bacterium]|jgi:metal-responsive CopG/Arc/MetJ family transcriptional regulator
MERLTISLPRELLERLRRVAGERGTCVAALIREAVEEKLERYRRRPGSVGTGASGHTDTARRTAEERVLNGRDLER